MNTVTAAIIVHDGRVLLARRAPGEKLAGRWEFPGGKLEDGEDEPSCLHRELIEELGIECHVGDFFAESVYDYQGRDGIKSIRLVAYLCEITSGTPTPRVHDQLAWSRPADIVGYALAPADVAIAEKVQIGLGSA
jgi:8-oxo-dGTP diphosphatase